MDGYDALTVGCVDAPLVLRANRASPVKGLKELPQGREEDASDGRLVR